MSSLDILRDIGGASGVLAFLGVAVDKLLSWLAKREERATAKEQADGKVALVRTEAEREKQRAEDDSRRIEAQAKTAQADAHSECLELAREQGRTIKEQGQEIGIVKDVMAGMSRELGTVSAKLEHCESQHAESIRRHDEKDGLILRLKSRVDVLEKRSHPPEAAE